MYSIFEDGDQRFSCLDFSMIAEKYLEKEMSVATHVKGTAKFSFYRAGNLYYTTESGLEFPVPLEDTDGATFLVEDKAIFFMRWIRKHLGTLNSGIEGVTV